MADLLREVLPLALGAAVSPLLLTATLLVLSSRDRPLARGVAVALGAAIPLLALGLFGLVAFRGSIRPDAGGAHSAASAWMDIALGAVLLGLGVRVLRRPAADKPPPDVRQSTLFRSTLLGLGMMLVNLTTAILYIAAVKRIARSAVELGDQLTALGIVLLITLIPVLVPILAYAIAPGPASRVLGRLGDWVERHRRAISLTLLLGFGVYLLNNGISAL